MPGSALCFSSKKATVTDVTVIAFPSKSEGMFVRESLIFRSDSNGEDLAGYAGAGLYESITMDPTLTETVDYSADAILVDEAFRCAFFGCFLGPIRAACDNSFASNRLATFGPGAILVDEAFW